MPRKLPRDAGLTLLELLVVVTILVLLTVAIGTVALNYLDRGKAGAAKLQLEQIETGLDLFRLDVGRYPNEQEGLDALVTAPGGLDRWNGPYVKREAALTDPWGNAFVYSQPGTDGPFDLMSLGADGQQGGEDDAADISSR